MKVESKRNLHAIALLVMGIFFLSNLNIAKAQDTDSGDGRPLAVQGRIVAVGIPGASAITPVGNFVPTGPIPTLANLKSFIQPGQVLDPVRILVGSNSNFGAALARTDQREGSFLSIDPTGPNTLVIPADFASAGGQASTLGGSVQVYTANNAAFLNSIENPSARTGNFTGVSNPLGISLNWAFGRLWPANAPTGLEGTGTSTILDPQGWGLKGAPNANFGGVYAGNLVNRGTVGVAGVTGQAIPGGLNTGAVGTAFLGASPDGSGKAVFVVVEADGSIVQEHTLQGLDGLVPPGTISPLLGQRDKIDGNGNPGVTPRLGVVFKWETISNGLPPEILYISEPSENRIAALVLTTTTTANGKVFAVSTLSHFSSDALNQAGRSDPGADGSYRRSFCQQHNAGRRFGFLCGQPGKQYDRPDDPGWRRGLSPTGFPRGRHALRRCPPERDCYLTRWHEDLGDRYRPSAWRAAFDGRGAGTACVLNNNPVVNRKRPLRWASFSPLLFPFFKGRHSSLAGLSGVVNSRTSFVQQCAGSVTPLVLSPVT